MMFSKKKQDKAPLLKAKRPQFTIPTTAFLNDTVEYAVDRFVEGYVNQAHFEGVLTHIEQHIRPIKKHQWRQFYDARFPQYNANVVNNLVAGGGPRSPEEAGEFFHSLIEAKIKYVIGYGEHVGTGASESSHFCFLDYFLPPENYTITYLYNGGKIEVSLVTRNGIPFKIDDDKLLYYPSDENFLQTKLKVIDIPDRESKRERKESEVTVTYHQLTDNWYAELNSKNDALRDIYLEHYEQIYEGPVFIHCASGVGRTGLAILTLEILRHFNKIFQKDKEYKSAAEILKIVSQIRKTRPGLIWTDNQLEWAIRNAVALAEHANNKKKELRTDYRPFLQPADVPEWEQYLDANVRQGRPCPYDTDDGETSLSRIAPRLIFDLREHITTQQDTDACLPCCDNPKKKAHSLAAAKFLVELLEKKTPQGTIEQYQDALRAGALGKIIRVYAKEEGIYIDTVRNLLKIAYNVAVAAHAPTLNHDEEKPFSRALQF